ncbi:MAG: ferritin-like domain-containing protein [Opitutae bacterium]|nr:ferritin-like domain-containing protein [Opitutae bacterium]
MPTKTKPARSSAKLKNLHDLFVEQLQDIYSAETQLVKALPQMAKAANDDALRDAFEEHLDQTKVHVERLESIFDRLDDDAKGRPCKAMKGLIAEGEEMIEEKAEPAVKDAGLIAAAQRIEHYEIASYGCVRTYAELLGDLESAQVLQTTLDEEGETDKKLTDLADSLNLEAESADEGDEDEDEE